MTLTRYLSGHSSHKESKAWSAENAVVVVESAATLLDPSVAAGSVRPFPPGMKGLSLEQAIRAMTIDAAWQLRVEEKIGSLEVGKYADSCLLHRALAAVSRTLCISSL